MRILVVGAGIAGLTAAGRLRAAGHDVVVVDKGRDVGGRTAARAPDPERGPAFSASFDHGAQYFTVRDLDLQDTVVGWTAAGVAAVWEGRVRARESQGSSLRDSSPRRRYVGVPTMRAIAQHLARGLEIQRGRRLTSLAFDAGGERVWRVTDSDGEGLGADALVLAIPPANIEALVEASEELPGTLRTSLQALTSRVVMAPCQAALIRLHTPIDFADEQTAFDGLFANDPVVAWLCRENSKPGRPEAPGSWTLHATAEWSRAHLEDPAEQVAAALREAFVGLLQPLATPGFDVEGAIASLDTHRWRYALPEEVFEGTTWHDSTRRLAVAGDWCAGPRVEGAWRSGRAAADALLATNPGERGDVSLDSRRGSAGASPRFGGAAR